MRTLPYRFGFALSLFGVLLARQGLACVPPPGFVNPPRPEIAPLGELLARTEQIVVSRPLHAEAKAANRPLQEAVRPTRDLPGVSGTFRLSDGPYGAPGARRLVCLTDGSFAVEELLVTESHDDSTRFRYAVWNYTGEKFRDVDYAVGEFIRTAPAPDKTHVHWTYRFALKKGRDPVKFRKSFLDSVFAEWMRSQLERGRAHAESAR